MTDEPALAEVATYHVRIQFRSGTSSDLHSTNQASDPFKTMRDQYEGYLKDGKSTYYRWRELSGGTQELIVRWEDVSALTTWRT